jgi:hypothetical protein
MPKPKDEELIFETSNDHFYHAANQPVRRGICGGMSYDWLARSLQLTERRTGDQILDQAMQNKIADAGDFRTQKMTHAKYYHTAESTGFADLNQLPRMYGLRHETDFTGEMRATLATISARNGFYISGTEEHYFAFRIWGSQSLLFDPNHGCYSFRPLQRFREAVAGLVVEEWGKPEPYTLWCFSVILAPS